MHGFGIVCEPESYLLILSSTSRVFIRVLWFSFLHENIIARLLNSTIMEREPQVCSHWLLLTFVKQGLFAVCLLLSCLLVSSVYLLSCCCFFFLFPYLQLYLFSLWQIKFNARKTNGWCSTTLPTQTSYLRYCLSTADLKVFLITQFSFNFVVFKHNHSYLNSVSIQCGRPSG